MARRRTRAAPSFFRRRSTRWLIAAILTLAVGIILAVVANRTSHDPAEAPTLTPAGATVATRSSTSAPTPPATVLFTATPSVALPTIVPEDALLIEAEVLDVIDGDTIDVRVGGQEERVRYYGVDTPERGDRCHDEAAARNEELAGARVLLLPDARERDRYDRLLRYVFTEEGESIDARLIAEGLGYAWREDGAYRDTLVALEGEARAREVGCLWGEE